MIGNIIKQLREEKGLKQEELAKQLSIAPSTIGMYETDKREPNNELTIKIANFFNVSIDYLLGKSHYKNYEEFKRIDDLVSNYQRTPEETELIAKALNYINTHKDENVEDIVKNAIVSLPTEKQQIIKKIILHLHFRYHSKLPNKNELTKDINIEQTTKYYMCPVYGRISAGTPNWAEECIEGRLPIDYKLMNILNPEECFFLRVNGESMNKEIQNGAYALIRKQDMVENGEIAVVLVNGYDATLKRFSKQGDLVILEPMSSDPDFSTQVYNKDTEIKVIGKYIGKMEMK